ncbi:hypothetical protein R3P38DRAFT_3520695 [Favolaschia claudopus]|uniref:Uncharacterized protein n=1 Tax=Favolaschia claudopus TaxID=2862362 RepID=A0AAW0BMI3_9AGAR
MNSESDSEEVITELSSDVVLNQQLTMFNVSGGLGGQGGRGGQKGGAGGNGEGPTFNFSRAERLIFHVNDGTPPQFSTCDINLQREVYLNDSRVCSRRKRDLVRRYYTTEVKNRKDMTVVVYEGQDAEKKFKKDVAKYMKFRHPSFLQLYGIVHSENVHAAIFYDVLIPWRDIDRIYQSFPVVLCYIYASAVASRYLHRRFGSTLNNPALFLRPSTGRLCIDLEGPAISKVFYDVLAKLKNISPMSLVSTIDTQTMIDALPIKEYHRICDRYFSFWDNTYTQFPLTATAHLGGVYHTTGHYDLGNPVATAPTLDILVDYYCWHHLGWYLDGRVNPHITESGWNRILFTVELDPQSATPTDWHSLDAFLFLCPPKSFHVGPVSFKCPECVGYWSFDPSGVDRLSEDEALELGFPIIHSSIDCGVDSWSDTVYAGLRQFHQGKGFDPDSQELARHLGYPLYELYSEYDNSMDVDGKNKFLASRLEFELTKRLQQGKKNAKASQRTGT